MQEVRETSIDFISTIDKKVLEEQQTAFNALKIPLFLMRIKSRYNKNQI